MSEIVDEPNGAGSGRSEAQVSNSLKHSKEEKQWVAALNSKNCKRLMALLHRHPSLWQKKAPGGRTVLHVAVMQGCVKLVELVLPGTPLENDNQKEFQENSKTLLSAIDGKCRADAFQLSAIVGNQEVIQVLNSARPPGFRNRSSRSTPYDADPSDASRHIAMKSTYSDSSLEVEIIDLLNELPSSELHESLLKQMNEDVDYNFEEHRKGLIINFACKRAHSNIEFLRSVKSKAEEKPLLWQKLLTQMDAQGRTPLHVAVDHYKGAELDGIGELLQLMPDECVNGRDGAGRTPLMRATANGMGVDAGEVVKVLANHSRTDLNAVWPSPEPKSQITGASGVTALHLAVLHGHGPAVNILLGAQRKHPEDRADVEKQMTRRIKVFKRQSYLKWTPLELAAVTGRQSVLKHILEACQEPGRKAIRDQHCLHLAAAAGNPLSIQHLLHNRSNHLQNFEPNHNFGGLTCLHFAVSALLPHQRAPWDKRASVYAIDDPFDRFLAFSDFASIYWLEQELTTAASKGPQKLGMHIPEYRDKKLCTNMLLQAGVDIWPSGNFLIAASDSVAKDFPKRKGNSPVDDGQDFHNNTTITRRPTMPEPGSNASDDARIWWFELVANETLNAKNNFSAAANATGVVAALVATASFMGPISPPLGYGSDASSTWTLERVQMDSPSIRVFMASNSLSFYLGIASIMLAIMPSLPLPQASLKGELRRSQRTVALAISLLLLSILGLLVSFTSALIAVMPRHHYWSYTFYPAFVGGIICIVVIFLFFLRVLRLVLNKNATIRNFYHLYGLL